VGKIAAEDDKSIARAGDMFRIFRTALVNGGRLEARGGGSGELGRRRAGVQAGDERRL
jgi:hypothetical protein